MKTTITILLVILTVYSYGQKNKYNDWFDLNLKGKPKSIKEVEIFSLTDFLKPNLTRAFNSSVKSEVFINEYHFDSLGVISKEFHKSIIDTSDKWKELKKKTILNYKDSIIVISYMLNGNELIESCREKRYLDKNAFIRCRITDFSIDTTLYERDKNNRIIKIFYHFIGIDTQLIMKIENELNENGDIILQKKYTNHFGVMYDEPSIQETITTYKYIYDSFNNWIIKCSIENNGINILTQREITY